MIKLNFSGSPLTINGLQQDFYGSWNYTVFARFGDILRQQIVQVFYSDFNITHPSKYAYYDVFPSSGNQTNLTPYLQSDSTPIWNFTNQAYDEVIDIYVRTNASLNACMNITFGNNSNRSNPANNLIKLNISWQKIETNITLPGVNNFTQINESVNMTINSTSGPNTTNLNNSSVILNLQEEVRNASSPFVQLNRNVDYRINYTTGNFTLINVSYNQTRLFVTYNHTKEIVSWERNWNWVDLYSCTSGLYLPWFHFAGICTDCVITNRTNFNDFNLITE